MYLEFVPQSKELKKDVEEITQIPLSTDTEKNLANKGKALRGLRFKWEGKTTVAFMKEVERLISLTDKPVVIGNRPVLPNPDAFDSTKPEQVDEYKARVGEVFELLLKWTEVKKQYEGVSAQQLEPENRFMEVTQGIGELLRWVTPVEKKAIQMPSGTITLIDDGSYPGHMVAELHPNDIDRAKYLASLDYGADQAGFKVYSELPTEPESGATFEEQLRSLSKEKLLKVAEKAKIEIPKNIKKEELVKLLLGAKN